MLNMTDEDKLNQIWFHVGKMTTNIESMKDSLESLQVDVALLKQDSVIRTTTRSNIVGLGRLIKVVVPVILGVGGFVIGKGIIW